MAKSHYNFKKREKELEKKKKREEKMKRKLGKKGIEPNETESDTISSIEDLSA